MRQRDENKIQAIREKALEMIAEEGLENFGINRLAKAVGVSPATIYIYYKDKDDLINQVSIEEGLRMCHATLKGFDPGMSFEEGLWVQWNNRARYALNNQRGACFFDQLRNSTYREKMLAAVAEEMGKKSRPFLERAMAEGVISRMPFEVFWAIAFAPLYSLVQFHHDKRAMNGRTFVFTRKIMRETFEYVLKALKK